MITMALIVFFTLAAIAALHAAWGFGVYWPAPDERTLVALVIGQTGRTSLPSRPDCLRASVAIFLAGVSALALVDLVEFPLPPYLISAAGALVALIFAARGAAAYLPAWRRRFAQEPFATMDTSWYGPFCLLRAVVFAVLVIKRIGSST
jgi:Protein of unknown function (DUF3995)